MTARVVVISDTHMPGRARKLPPVLVADLERADLILHAGDFATVETLEALRGFAPVQGVYGNVDEPELRCLLPRRLKIELFGRWVGLVHGDSPSLPTVARAVAEFVDEQLDLIVFGHSHRPLLRREGDMLRCDVIDNGRGLRAGHKEGVGLASTRQRLAHLYGDQHTFSLRGAPGEGVHVTMAIPFHHFERTAAD